MTSRRERILSRIKGDPFADTWKMHQYSVLARRVAELVPDGSSVIDFGCGEGLFSSRLRRSLAGSIVGIDLFLEPGWHRNDGVQYLVGDAHHAPLRPACAETVIAKDLLHHADDPITAAQTLVKTASKAIVLVEANAENPVMAFYTRHNNDHHFNRPALLQLLDTAAPDLEWNVSYATAYPFYLPPVGGVAALWVWPLTAIMLLLFKVLRSRHAARALHKVVARFRWQPSYLVVTARIPRRRATLST